MTRHHDVADSVSASHRRVRARVESFGGPPRGIHGHDHLAFPAMGKGARAWLCLLAASAVGGRATEAEVAATVSELLHLASLYHDDVLDAAPERRGHPTPYAVLGAHQAILRGDLIIAGVFSLVPELPDRLAGGIVGAATAELVAGELEQASFRRRADVDLGALHRVARRKTGALFGLAGMLGGRCGHRRALGRDLGAFGSAFGEGFQLLDDILDYAERPGEEPPGADFQGGVPTVPFRLALDLLRPSDRARLVEGLVRPGRVPVEEAVALVAGSGALAATAARAATAVAEGISALGAVPESPARQSLAEMGTGLLGLLSRWAS